MRANTISSATRTAKPPAAPSRRTRAVYRRLLGRFGAQGWWPTTPAGGAEPAYFPGRPSRPLSEAEMFEICAGAILTQNTAWSNVRKALAELNRRGWLDPRRIARAPFPALARAIRSSGYFRQKAKKLKIFARFLLRHYGGKVGPLLDEPLPGLRAKLLAIHGVGPETADSILLYAGRRPVFVVDAYTRRIGERLGFFRTQDYREVQEFFQRGLSWVPEAEKAAVYNEAHALLVALGKDFCRPRPLCRHCPLAALCPGRVRP